MPNPTAIVDQYRAIHATGGFCFRADRGLIEVTGADRATWLNNLVTNVVKTLQPGEGNYAFATNVKGRVVFDCNMLVLEDRLWLDIDARLVPAALAHLNKYIITEDVTLADLTTASRRIAVLGPSATSLAQRLAVGNVAAMAQLQHVRVEENHNENRLVRNDFCGLPSVEYILAELSASNKFETIQQRMKDAGFLEVGAELVEILRIEAGIPKSVDDIDDDVVPPETGQIERGISYHKGCYLGQEVIERMRSHGILARKLVGIQIDGGEFVAGGTSLRAGDQDVGRITSCCWSEALKAVLALGYVKMAYANPGTSLSASTTTSPRPAQVIALPVSREHCVPQ